MSLNDGSVHYFASLRQEAEQRAIDNHEINYNSYTVPSSSASTWLSHSESSSSSPIEFFNPVAISATFRDGRSSSSGSNNKHKPFLNHPLFRSERAAEESQRNNLVDQARKEWHQHGDGITQSLEEKRMQSFLQDNIDQNPGGVVVRVISAEQRVDLSGSKFTSYVIRVQQPGVIHQLYDSNINNNPLGRQAAQVQVEHRYSEFCKLNDIVKLHNVQLDVPFPSKSWAGRVGSWTPSLALAPDKYNDLIKYRIVQLDIWLVHLASLYNCGKLHNEVAQVLYEFLFMQNKPPPCNLRNITSTEQQNRWIQWNNPVPFTLGSSIRQATKTIEYMCLNAKTIHRIEQSIPLDLLHAAKGLCFMTVAKAGFVVSGRIGTGLVISRLDHVENKNGSHSQISWSAPCAIGTIGMGWGALAGGEITHYLVVLTSHKAVQDICNASTNGTSIQLGAELNVAVGPVGRGAKSHIASGDWAIHPAYAYAHSQGLFVGISLEGSVITVRNDVNAKFYGEKNITPQKLWSSPGPLAAEPLYKALQAALAVQMPQEGLRPSQFWTNDIDNDNLIKYQCNHP